MPSPSAYFNFIAREYPQFIDNSGEVSVAKLPLVDPQRENVDVGGNALQITKHWIVIGEQQADVMACSLFTYEAVLESNGDPLWLMQVDVDSQNYRNSRIKFTDIGTKNIVQIYLENIEKETLACLASFYTTPSMRMMNSRFNKHLHETSQAYFAAIKLFWGSEQSYRQQNIDSLINQARYMASLGGQDFVSILERIRVNFLQEKTDIDFDHDYLLVEDEGNVTSVEESVELKNSEFRGYFSAINFQVKELKNHLNSMAVSDLHNIYHNGLHAIEYVGDDEINVSLDELKKLHLIIAISMRVLLDKLQRALLIDGNDVVLSGFVGSPALAHIQDSMFILLVKNGKPASLAWLIENTGSALDIIIKENEDGPYKSLLEIALEAKQSDAFKVLLQYGANPMFFTGDNRCFLHDIMQVKPSLARDIINCDFNIGNWQTFFASLVKVTEVWQRNVSLDPVEARDLSLVLDRYRSANDSFDAIESNFFKNDEYMGLAHNNARIAFGLVKELPKYLVVESFQTKYKEAILAYTSFNEKFIHLDTDLPFRLNSLASRLLESIKNNKILSQQNSLGDKIKFLTRAHDALKSIDLLIDKQKVLDDGLQAVKRSNDRATTREIKLRNKNLSEEVKVLEISINDFINSPLGKDIRPSQGGFWSSLTTYVADSLGAGSQSELNMVSILAEPFLKALEAKKSASAAEFAI